MTDAERLACWTGVVLLGLAAVVMFGDKGALGRRGRREPPVETLAEELKDRWGEYHSP